MPNLMIDFTKSFVSSFTPSSLSELKSNANEIMDTVMGGAKTAQDTYRKMRSGGGFKKVVDWFTQRGDDFGSMSLMDDASDEFDAGTDFGVESTSSAKVLDYESMRDLTKGQVGAMFQIGGKQVEASAMTTSEIISVVNTRSSEILSSLGNINSSLNTISSQLAKIVENQVGTGSRSGSYRRSNGIFDSSGNITLGSVFSHIKSNAGQYTQQLEMLKGFNITEMLGMMSPGDALGTILGMVTDTFAGDLKLFGGRTTSINDLKDMIDNSVANIQNHLLTKLLSWDKFQKYFGNQTRDDANKNYARFIENQYNRDKAVFDGMTRATIVDVIPSYLRKITAALTGKEFYVSAQGQLTTEAQSGGFKDVFRGAIQSPFSSSQITRMQKKSSNQMSQTDIDLAQRILMSLYVGISMQRGIMITSSDIFKDGGYPDVNAHAVELLASNSGKDASYWSKIVNWIIGQMQIDSRARETFTRTLNRTVRSTDSSFINYAKTAVNVRDVGQLTQSIVDDVVSQYIGDTGGGDDRTFAELIKAKVIKRADLPAGLDTSLRPSDIAARDRTIAKMQSDSASTDVTSSLFGGQQDYVASIFDILNRGINVYSVKRKGPYPKMEPRVRTKSPVAQAVETMIPTVVGINPESGDGGSGGETQQQQQQPSASDTLQEALSLLPQPLQQVATHVQGLFNSPIATKLMTEFQNMQEDYTAGRDLLSIKRDVSKMGGSEDEKHDQQIAQAVLAAMQAATADGDTNEDLSAISSQISDIKDPALKSRLQSIVEGTLRRASQKKPAKSKIGQILMWGWGIIQKTIVPFVSKIKTFVTSLGKKFIMPLINSLKSSGEKIITGARSIKEGFTGSEESIGIFGRIRNLGAGIRSKFSKGSSPDDLYYSDKFQTLGDISDYDTYTLGGEQSEKSEAEKQKAAEEKKKAEEEKAKAKEKKPKKESKILKSLQDTLKKSQFVQGITDAWKGKNQKLTDMKPQTLADQATKGILDILKSKDGKEGGGESIFSTIFKKMDAIRDVFSTSVERIDESDDKSGSGEKGDDDKSLTPGGSTTPDETGDVKPTGDTPDTTGTNSDTKTGDKKKSKGLAFDLGKIFGGFTKILGGIGQAVLSVIAEMAGFKAIMKLISGILTKSLKPLNRAFQTMYKAMKPIVKQIESALKDIVKYAVEIVESLVTIMGPILEAVGPIVEQLLEVLTPILNMVTDLINVLMVPLVAIMQSVVVPLLRVAANTLEILLGVVQVGMGLILSAIGGLLVVVGTIASIFTQNDSLTETGSKMWDMGTSMVKSGANSVVSGMQKTVALVGEVITDTATGEAAKTVHEAAKETAVQNGDKRTPLASAMDGIYGSGDAQGSYSDYLNMKNRGCGPVALADSMSRRSGASISAKQVATAMAGSGTYDPARGTSVGGYIRASRSMGMNLTPGGVTAASLAQATPTNPITIIGSGTDFATRRGNNHYMNVIGTSHGQAIVSNPMTGRIERKSIGSVVSNSMLGLYGAGDGDTPYAFSDGVQDALATLKELVGQIVGIFTGDSDSVESKLDAANTEQKYQQMQIDTSNFTEEEQQQLDAEARKLFEAETPRHEGETDKEFEERYQKNKSRYWTMAATKLYHDKVLATAGGNDEGAKALIDTALGKDGEAGFLSGWYDDMMKASKETAAASPYGMTGGANVRRGRGFYSDHGARLYTDEYTPSVYFNDASNWNHDRNYQLILGEFFQHMMDNSYMTSAYDRYGPPADKDAVGQAGSSHGGTDFSTGGNPYVRATTGGTVEQAVNDSGKTGFGTVVKIRDIGGDLHIYGHMLADPGVMVHEGDVVEGGTILGKMGSTGNSTGTHLHYEIRNANGETVNPHTFFKWHDGAVDGQGKIVLTDYMTSASDVFTPHIDELIKAGYHDQAVAAGLTPAQESYVAAVGLVENGGARLTGSDVTLVHNGHFGVSNWTTKVGEGGHDDRYGKTLAEQLRYGFVDNYFSDNPKHSRAYIIDNYNTYAPSLEAVLGKPLALKIGDRWAPYLEEDLLEATGHGVGNAVIPDQWQYPDIYGRELAAAARYYNWMIEQGYVNPTGTGSTYWENYANTNSFTGSAAGDDVFRKTSAYTETAVDGVPYSYKQTGSRRGWYNVYNRAGELLFSAVEQSGFTTQAEHDQFRKAHKDIVEYIRLLPGGDQVIMYGYNFQTGTPSGQKAKSLLTTKYDKSSGSAQIIQLANDDYLYQDGDFGVPIIVNDYNSFQNVLDSGARPLTNSDSIKNQTGSLPSKYNWGSANVTGKGKGTSTGGVSSKYDWSNAKNATKVKNTNSKTESILRTIGESIIGIPQGLQQIGELYYDGLHGSGDVDGLDTLLNMGDDTNPVIINRYETAARQSTDESIDVILNNTYNVRSEKIESMLGEMLKIMRDRNKRRANRRAQQSASQLPPDERFPSNDIPSQVERLSVG